ncbi:hypothetical protein KI387_034170, partial [Taxus chinensis]
VSEPDLVCASHWASSGCPFLGRAALGVGVPPGRGGSSGARGSLFVLAAARGLVLAAVVGVPGSCVPRRFVSWRWHGRASGVRVL